MAKLNLNSIETEILAVVRTLTAPNLPPTLVINIGMESTSLAIIRDGILVLTYVIQTGGKAISRSIGEDFGLTPSQSEEYKKTYGFSKEGEDAKKISKSTEPILASILVEVRKVLAFYSQKYRDDSVIQQVLLSGGTAHLSGISSFFAKNLGIEAVVNNPWKIFGNKSLPPEILKNNTSDFAVVLGLAIRDI